MNFREHLQKLTPSDSSFETPKPTDSGSYQGIIEQQVAQVKKELEALAQMGCTGVVFEGRRFLLGTLQDLKAEGIGVTQTNNGRVVLDWNQA